MDPLKAKQRMQTSLIVWGALLWTAIMYLGLTFILQPAAGSPALTMLYNIGLGLSLLGLFLGHFPKFRSNPQKAQSIQTIALALCESCALMGLVLFMTSEIDPVKPRSMIGLALVAMATLFPTPKRMGLESAK